MTSRQQWGLVTGGWVAYVIYYLGRTNLSVAVPGLESEGGLGPEDIGLLVAAFFWVYSLTQVVVGQLADRFGSRWLVGVGLVGSGVMNALFIHAGSFTLALIWWSLNGMFQGFGWPPLIAGLSRWLTGPRAAQASAAYGTSYVAGTVLTLAAGGFIVAWGALRPCLTWRRSFLSLPGSSGSSRCGTQYRGESPRLDEAHQCRRPCGSCPLRRLSELVG